MSVTVVYGRWVFPKKCLGVCFCRFYKTVASSAHSIVDAESLQGFQKRPGDTRGTALGDYYTDPKCVQLVKSTELKIVRG